MRLLVMLLLLRLLLKRAAMVASATVARVVVVVLVMVGVLRCVRIILLLRRLLVMLVVILLLLRLVMMLRRRRRRLLGHVCIRHNGGRATTMSAMSLGVTRCGRGSRGGDRRLLHFGRRRHEAATTRGTRGFGLATRARRSSAGAWGQIRRCRLVLMLVLLRVRVIGIATCGARRRVRVERRRSLDDIYTIHVLIAIVQELAALAVRARAGLLPRTARLGLVVAPALSRPQLLGAVRKLTPRAVATRASLAPAAAHFALVVPAVRAWLLLLHLLRLLRGRVGKRESLVGVGGFGSRVRRSGRVSKRHESTSHKLHMGA